jgi:DNA processing protein
MTMEEDAWAAVLLSMLPRMPPKRLRAMLGESSPSELLSAIRSNQRVPWSAPVEVRARWQSFLDRLDLQAERLRYENEAVRIIFFGGAGYPSVLKDDPDAPPVLFMRGRCGAELLEHGVARVAVVGTRRSTGYGADAARELGRDLACAGVTVVSGLAIGVDAAAHQGALSAGSAAPLGVVGTGLDVVYPRRSAALWREVAERGAILSEFPLGTGPDRWRFPCRNRIVAALSDALVVVESRESGGAMSTVEAALARGVEVMAVPGPVRSVASAGTNRLLHEGASVARDAADVLAVLSLRGLTFGKVPQASLHVTSAAGGGGRDECDVEARRLSPEHREVLAVVGYHPTPTAEVLQRCASLSFGMVSMALEELEGAGLVRRGAGWWERT